MSLLLEALKKAELAKQIAKSESGLDAPAAAQPPSQPAAPGAPRENRSEVRPLELLGDDYPPSDQKTVLPGAGAAGTELSFEDPNPAMASPPPYEADDLDRATQRAQAQQVFEAKEMDYNPRRPFYLTIAALALAGVGYGGYVWWQLQPKSYVAVASAPPAAPTPPAPASPPPPAATAPAATAAPAVPSVTAPAAAPAASIRSTAPAAPTTSAPATTKVDKIAPIQPVRPPRARPRTQTAVASAPRRSPPIAAPEASSVAPQSPESATSIAVSAPARAIDPTVDDAYRALQRNDLAAASAAYQRVLGRDPTNRDALLGLAAISVRVGDLSSAEARYLRLLELDPRDAQAVAGIVAIQGQLDPVAAESRLKTLIATQPQAAPLHFALGNQYAKQSRWPEAQSAYFKAYSLNQDNADYAFNLAVSLDQMRQVKPALQYYGRALQLTERQTASFNPAQIRNRVQQLGQ